MPAHEFVAGEGGACVTCRRLPHLHDEADARAAREEAIERVELNADPMWKAAALAAVVQCAERLDVFTADDVWDELAEQYPEAETHNPAALGPVFRRAQSAGLVIQTGRTVPTRNARRHRELTEWRQA